VPLRLLAILALALVLVGGVVARAGLTRRWVSGLGLTETRQVKLRVWDWWSASTNEEYGDYFGALEAEFEARNPDVDIVYQVVPFGNYVQKLSTAMVGDTPPDVFQSSVYWAEGFYHRGMLRQPTDSKALPSQRHVANPTGRRSIPACDLTPAKSERSWSEDSRRPSRSSSRSDCPPGLWFAVGWRVFCATILKAFAPILV